MVCNSGVSLTPLVNNQVYHFAYVGLYNGLALVRDEETNSFWSHYTGECVHGQHQGEQLALLAPIQHMTAQQALQRYPDAEIALAQSGFFPKLFARIMGLTSLTAKGSIPPHFYKTMDKADDRRPRLDMGLGIWDDTIARYYPMNVIRANPLIVDSLNERQIVIYLAPTDQAPIAFYSNATSGEWQGNELHLGTGEIVRDGQLHRAEGGVKNFEQPLQQFTRWYGFSYTFPGCELFTGQ